MSGLAGLVTLLPAEQARQHLAAMLGSMMHEPSYGHGVSLAPELGCYLGWVDSREPSPGRTGMLFEHDAKTLLFSGEHLGDDDGRRGDGCARLPGDRLAADTLLASYGRHGIQAFRQLNGWFAGVLVDRRRRDVVVFVDRLGVRRLYFAQSRLGCVFATEAKAILAIDPASRELDPEGLGQFFAGGFPLGGTTLFKGVSRLPGGSAWTIAAGRAPQRSAYFTASELEAQPSLSPDEFYARLDAELERVVPRYVSSDGPLALSLTGGLDSRAIVAYAPPGALELSYTYGGLYRECLDVKVAREVALAAGCRHHVINLDDAFLRDFARHAEETVWVTDGAADISTSHELPLSRRARCLAPVRLTGNYGSEVLRDACSIKPLGLDRRLFAGDFWPYVEQAEASLTSLRALNASTVAAYHDVPGALFGRLAAAQGQLVVRSPYTDNAIVALAYQRPRLSKDVVARWASLLGRRAPAIAAIRTDREQLGGLPSGRSRARRWANHLAFKAEWYYDGGMPNWLSGLDWRFGRRRPPFPFVGYHKIQNYRLWYRDEVADVVGDLLCGSRSRFYANGAAVSRASDAHRSGRRNCAQEISMFGTAELIQRLLIDEPAHRLRTAGQIRPDVLAIDARVPQ